MSKVVIVGGGQSALACGYYLRRSAVEYLILDDQEECGGAWLHGWDSLSLFSPSDVSSLPGWLMPRSKNKFPSRDEVIEYLCAYESRYDLPVKRPVKVERITRNGEGFLVKTDSETIECTAVIAATGTWKKPLIPPIPGRSEYRGIQVHSSAYKNADPFKGKKVLVVGEGNSGAQILAEVSKVADTSWATKKDPEFLPDEVDGRVLFDQASAKYYAKQKGESFTSSVFNLGNIVMVPSVVDARERKVLVSKGRFKELYTHGVVWENGTSEPFDAIIWCTGFGYATDYLQEITEIKGKGIIETVGTRAKNVPGLWLVGFGGWTGFASSTLIGVGRSARKTVKEIEEFLEVKE